MEPDHLREDLKQEVILVICELPEEKIIGLHERKELEFYTVRVILNMLKNKYSQFYRRYRQTFVEYNPNESEQIESSEYEERLLREQIEDVTLEEINKLYWYDKELIMLYLKHKNFRSIQAETNIPLTSIYQNIKKSMATLKRAAQGDNKPIFTKAETNYIQNKVW